MSGKYDENHSMSWFHDIVENKRKEQQYRVDKCISCLNKHQIPTPDSIRGIINSLVGEARQQVLRHHMFWKEWTLREGLSSLLHASHQASIDICRHDAALGELACSESFQKEVDRTVGYAAQKDVVAYCALAFGIRDILKEIIELRPDIKVKVSELRNALFDADISEFLRELRNHLLHGRVVIPQWEVSYGLESPNNTGSMIYHVGNLMQSVKWNDESRKYVSNNYKEKIQLSIVIRHHFKLLNETVREIQNIFPNNVSTSEQDYFDIEDAHKRETRRQWAKITVSQVAGGKNPYDYLHIFFDPETQREILRYPLHSKEQVDFIMALKAAEIDWDDELRSTMYQIFRVTRDSDA